MAIKTLADAIKATFKMAKAFQAYVPSTAPEGDYHPEHYGHLFARPLGNTGIFQFAMRANKSRLIRVTFHDEDNSPVKFGTEMVELWRKMQAINESHAFENWALPSAPMHTEFYTDPETLDGMCAHDKLTKDGAPLLWSAVDSLFSEKKLTMDWRDIDLVQLEECIKGVRHFVDLTAAPAFTKGAKRGAYGAIQADERFVLVTGGCDGVFAEAIVAPLK